MTRGATRLEQSSKLVVIVSAALAIVMEAYLGAREWRPLLQLTLGLFAGAFVLARLRPSVCWALVLPSLYLVPAIFLAAIGRELITYQVTWMAALFGAILATSSPSRWVIPSRWKLPLVFWALVVATTWPVVVARDCDFRSSMLLYGHIGNSGIGGNPASLAVWVQYVALTYMLGILWFDSLFHSFKPGDFGRFRRTIAAPLAVGVLVGSLVAVYQGVVDVTWLSAHQWPGYHRASGTLLDGDAFGALAAFWSSAFVGFAGVGGLGWASLGAAGAVVSWGGLWATGSRMGLLGGLIGLVFVLSHGARVAWRLNRRAVLFSGAATAVVVLALVALAQFGGPRWSKVVPSGRLFSIESPLARTVDSLPSLTKPSLTKFALSELWDRLGPFGSVSLLMVEQHPAVGVGIGSFHQLLPDYAYILTGVRRVFDNAQSWYRHLLAELGIVGSLGWLTWVAMFAVMLVRTSGEGARDLPAGALKGTFVAIAAVSAVSMPTQNAAVSITFWAFAFWYLLLIPEVESFGRLQLGRLASRGWAWVALWLVVLGCVAGTIYVGWKDLRPPYRALWANWDYAYGFYDLERPGNGEPFRWTRQHAVAVFPASSTREAWLKLTFWVHHPDVAENAVEVKIWRKDPDRERLIIDMQLHDSSPVTQYVKVPPVPHPRMMLETWVSRTWTPAALGQADQRELGLGVADWTFVDTPPVGAMVIR